MKKNHLKEFVLIFVICCFMVFPISTTEQQKRFRWLISEGFPLTQEDVMRIPVDAMEQRMTLNKSTEMFEGSDIHFNSSRPGLLKSCHFRFDCLNPDFGKIKPTSDGGFVWTMAIKSKQAACIQLHFKEFNLPGDVEVHIFNKFCQASDPYRFQGPEGSGEFWTEPLFGDTIYIRLRSYKPIHQVHPGFIQFSIDRIAHLESEIARIEFENGAVVEFKEVLPGFIILNEHSHCGVPAVLAQYDVEDTNVIDLYK